MFKKSNKGVCCNVCDCIHNEQGCDCNLNKITVSKGADDGHHYCKSYACKQERNTCECSGQCHTNMNIEVAEEHEDKNDHYNSVSDTDSESHSIYNSEFED